MFTLRSLTKNPPGMFCYKQTVGIQHQFDCNPDIKELARFVADFRAGNNLLRAGINDSLYDIITFNCQRLGNDPRWCYEVDGDSQRINIAPKKGGCCGHTHL